MKLLEIWKRLGKQYLVTIEHQDAKEFINNKEYIITNPIITYVANRSKK